LAFTNIDATKPDGSVQHVRDLDNADRETRSWAEDCFAQLSNYPGIAETGVPALKTTVWTTATRPTGDDLVDRVTGFNTNLGLEEYYDLSTTSWKPKGVSVNYGLGGVSKNLASNTDLNSIVDTGFYEGTGLVNAPGTGRYYIEVQRASDDTSSNRYVKQIATEVTDTTPSSFIRTSTGGTGTWNSWVETTNNSIINGSSDKVFNVANATAATNALALQQFTGSLGASGYFKVPVWNGSALVTVLVQWGVTTSGTTSFPTSFGSSPYRIFLNDFNVPTAGTGAKGGRTYYTDVSATGFKAYFTWPAYTHDYSTGDWYTISAPNCDYIAIGIAP
jgi:hypothetical protein